MLNNNLSIHLSIYLSIYLPIYLTIYIYLSIQWSDLWVGIDQLVLQAAGRHPSGGQRQHHGLGGLRQPLLSQVINCLPQIKIVKFFFFSLKSLPSPFPREWSKMSGKITVTS